MSPPKRAQLLAISGKSLKHKKTTIIHEETPVGFYRPADEGIELLSIPRSASSLKEKRVLNINAES
jgi:hypothetical protein